MGKDFLMSKEQGSRYTCDRCGKSEFVTPSNTYSLAQWHDIKRQSQRGEENRTYCESCYKAYLELLAKHDASFKEFESKVN